MNNLKLVAGIVGLVSLLSVIIATPALAQDKKSATVTFPEDKIVVVVKKCTVRTLDQGSGSVRICE